MTTPTPPPAPPPWSGQPVGWTPPPPPPGAWHPVPQPVAPNGQPLAGFGDRFLAFLIDYAIYLGVALVYTIPAMILMVVSMFSIMDEQFGKVGQDPYAPVTIAPSDMLTVYVPMLIFMAVVIPLGFLFTYLYFVEYQLRDGQTVGKRVMKLKVIPIEPGRPLTRGDLVKRWAVAWVVGSFVPLFHYLDGLWQLWDKPLLQCLHDKAAQTVVVKLGPEQLAR